MNIAILQSCPSIINIDTTATTDSCGLRRCISTRYIQSINFRCLSVQIKYPFSSGTLQKSFEPFGCRIRRRFGFRADTIPINFGSSPQLKTTRIRPLSDKNFVTGSGPTKSIFQTGSTTPRCSIARTGFCHINNIGIHCRKTSGQQ